MGGRFLFGLIAMASFGCSNANDVVNAPPGCSDAEGIASAVTGGSATTAEDLASAIGMGDAAAALAASAAAVAVFSGLGDIDATQGGSFAWLSTGVAGAGTTQSVVQDATPPETGTNLGLVGCAGASTFDCVALEITFTVPAEHNSVRFDFEFLSAEYPEYINAGYNDAFTVALASPSFNFENVSYDESGNAITINNAFFTDADCEDFLGTGFDIDSGFGQCDSGATGLLGTIAPVAPGETVTLTFAIHDAGDGLYDSAVMVDHLETTSAQVDEPETNECD